jgi:hypothetical protein
LSFFAWLIVLAGFFLFFRSEKIKVYFFSLGLPIVLFFAFFANRYAAKKYLLFIVPFLLIIYADSLYLIIKKVFKKYSSYFFIFVFIVFGSIITIPTAGDVHDYRTAYQYLEQHYQAGEPVLIQGKETYYFTRKDLDLISMKANKKYKFEEFKQVVDNNQSGWVVYPKFKSDHISDKIINYCKENLTSIEEVKETNVKIFHWGS